MTQNGADKSGSSGAPLDYFQSRIANTLQLLSVEQEELKFAVSQLEARFCDIERLDTLTEPRVRYVMATTSRVGGHFIGQVLEGTGVGSPKEYFSHYEIDEILSTMPHGNAKPRLGDYLAHIFSTRSSPTGVFGLKACFLDIVPFLLYRNWPFNFAGWKWVYLYRENIIDQATSILIAQRTGKWNSWAEGKPPESVEFDEGELFEAIKIILRDRMRWEAFFSLFGITPLRLSYEGMDRDCLAETQKVREFLKLTNADLLLREQQFPLSKQATVKNTEIRRLGLATLFNIWS